MSKGLTYRVIGTATGTVVAIEDTLSRAIASALKLHENLEMLTIKFNFFEN